MRWSRIAIALAALGLLVGCGVMLRVTLDVGGFQQARQGLRVDDVVERVDDLASADYIRAPGACSVRQNATPRLQVRRAGVAFDAVLTLGAEPPAL